MFYNLFINSIQHVGKDSKVEISIKRSGNFAHIVITDDGPGVPDALRSKLFQRCVSEGGDQAVLVYTFAGKS